MANPAPTINQINAFNATQGTTIDFNIIGGTELVRSNRIYIYDLSDNSLICTHLYVSTESIHELPPNTDGSIVYESGKSSADFVNGAQYYAQIQTFTDIAGTEGGSGLSVAKMFWCLVDPTLTITTIPSTISTTSYNVSATYNANTSVVSNIIQQYQFSLYSATGSLLQSSGVVVGSGTQQGTSTIYDISYNFTGLSVGSSYYVVVDVTTTQGMSVSVQSNTFTVSIDTPTLGEATVVNNACDGYISVTSNLSSEYGGSGSGEIVSFETDSENVFTKLQVDLDPIQDLHGYDNPWVGGAGKNILNSVADNSIAYSGFENYTISNGVVTSTGATLMGFIAKVDASTNYSFSFVASNANHALRVREFSGVPIDWTGSNFIIQSVNAGGSTGKNSATFTTTATTQYVICVFYTAISGVSASNWQLEKGTTSTDFEPYSNICPISGHDEVEVGVVGKNLFDIGELVELGTGVVEITNGYRFSTTSEMYNTGVTLQKQLPNPVTISMDVANITGTNLRVRVVNTDGTVNEPDGSGTGAGGHVVLHTTKPIKGIKFNWSSSGTFEVTNFQVEFGDTETTYSPYNGQSYTQDIEATYTPTMQDNTPYLFKRTGDVGGDRESIELVGGTVAWNQLAYAPPTQTLADVTFTKVNDYTININGTGTDVAYKRIIDEKTIINHIYFIGLSASHIGLAFYNDGGGITTGGGGQYAVGKATAEKYFYFRTDSGTTFNDFNVIPQIFDLTQMFGSTIADYIYTLEQGTAGAGVAFFRKYFPKPYYPYDAGTIKSVEGVSAHKTVGFNQWDEEWESGYFDTSGNPVANSSICRSKNFIHVVPNTAYFYKSNGQNHTFVYYDADKNFIRLDTAGGGNSAITTPSNAHYMKFAWVGTTYNHDICINLSWDGERNGEYEPYVEHSYPLDDSLTLRGIPKIANGKLYYDGDSYESDGTVTRKYADVDLTNVSFSKYSGDENYPNLFSTSGFRNIIKHTTSGSQVCDWVILSGYENTRSNDIGKVGVNDGYKISVGTNGTLWVSDPTCSTAQEFMNKMSGRHLVYELATPTTEQADTFEEIQKVTPNYGTEEFVTTTNVPVGNNTQYYTRDIYGGYIDLVSGQLVVDRKCISLPISGWSANSISATNAFFQYTLSDAISVASNNDDQVRVISDALKGATSHDVIGALSGFYSIAIITNKRLFVYVPSATFPDVNSFMTWLQTQDIHIVYELATPLTYQLTPQQIQTLVGVNNVWSEQGNVELSYHIPITNLLVKRQDVADVSGDWLTLYSQPITQASDMDFTFIDFTNQYGKTYKYALVPLLTQTQSGVEVEVEGGYTVSDEVQSVFDGVFIADSTGSQKCKANVGYGNVDMNQTVGTITPIGAKYPVVITNSQNQYHNGSISGTIVPDDYYFNGNLSRVDMVNKRDELEQFLTNKRAKIIKDWNGKIWLVMIMDNVSCTFNNNYGMGIVNFSTNWIEVGDPTNQQDLQATGLINVGGV